MKDIEEIKEILKSNKLRLELNYNLKSIGIFGSSIREDGNSNSDLDVLVDFSVPIDLFKFLELEEDLERICSKKIDLVSINSLKLYIGKEILSEVQYI